MGIKKWNRIREIKEATKLADAVPLFRKILDIKGENKEKLRNDLDYSFEVNGKLMLERAFLEKVLTPFEYADIHTRYGLEDKDFGTILTVYFNKNGKDEIKLLAMAYSNVYKAKDFIKERFGVDVVDMRDFFFFAKKKDPELFKKFLDEHNVSDEKFNEMMDYLRRDKKDC